MNGNFNKQRGVVHLGTFHEQVPQVLERLPSVLCQHAIRHPLQQVLDRPVFRFGSCIAVKFAVCRPAQWSSILQGMPLQ